MTHEPIRKALAALKKAIEENAPVGLRLWLAHAFQETLSRVSVDALLADLDRVTRERDEALTVLAEARGTIVELCESFGVPKPLATLGRIEAALGDVGV